MKTNDFSEDFTDLIRQWGRECSAKNYDHFGKWLVETVKQSEIFGVTTLQSTGLFLTRFKIKQKNYAGLLTSIYFDGQNLFFTLYGPKKMEIQVHYLDLSALYYERQPSNGTIFFIKNEELVKRTKEELTKTEGEQFNVSPTKPAKSKKVLVL
ncbi:MAG: hypothetical protein Q8P20_04935 [bacterium]|nr:hypothetical protein [bacterium]